jgi:hypothetical protein
MGTNRLVASCHNWIFLIPINKEKIKEISSTEKPRLSEYLSSDDLLCRQSQTQSVQVFEVQGSIIVTKNFSEFFSVPSYRKVESKRGLSPPRLPGFKPESNHVGFCDGQKWRWGRFSPRTSVSPVNLHSICFSIIIFTITRGWQNRPGVAAVPIASQTK